MKKWKCEVCGYIHEGDSPPDACPVCGVGPEKFTEMSGASAPAVAAGATSVNILEGCQTDDAAVKKVPAMATPELSFDTYYFKPGQVLAYHRHPTGDQIFVILKGKGEFYLDDGSEKVIDLAPGQVILAPKNVWHKIVNTGDDILIASQATKQPAGMEARKA